jgi:hypothetical protein
MPALLLHLPKLFAESPFLGSGSGLGCWLVVAIVQPTNSILLVASQNFKLEDNGD